MTRPSIARLYALVLALFACVTCLLAMMAIHGCESGGDYNELRVESDAATQAAEAARPGIIIQREVEEQEFPLLNSGPSARAQSGSPSADVPPQSRPAPDEELWIVQKPDRPLAASQTPADDVPGTGALMTRRPAADGTQEVVPVPLERTDVVADVAGFLASTTVTQKYHNPFDAKIEALYVFPLPHDSAVNEFLMTVGDRTIRGVVRERAEAEQLYAEARAHGHVASLLTEERPNVFTQAVANLEPGKRIDVTIRYFSTLEWRDGGYEYVFPMVVGPRFNPPGSTGGVGAVPQGTADARGVTGQPTNVPYLRPGQRSGHDVSIAVTLDAGAEIADLAARDHRVAVDRTGPATARVTLAADDAIPNKDFVLRYSLVGDAARTAMMVAPDDDGDGGHFALMLFPPADADDLPPTPLDLVFTVDVSGSMAGRPIEQARQAVRYALNRLTPDDTFNVVRFASTAERMSVRPVPATPDNVRAALRFLGDGGDAGGGTMMVEGVRQSLAGPYDAARLRYVTFLTDGFIGNEPEILAAVRDARCGDAAASRVFGVGVGSSPNRFLIDRMAKFGGGAAAHLGLQQDADAMMNEWLAAVRRPALANGRVEFGAMQVTDVYPEQLPDLYVSRPVTVVGRYDGALPDHVAVVGTRGGRAVSIDVPIDPARRHPAIATVWARRKIADLADRAVVEPSDADLLAAVRAVALEHGLMSAYTAFVAVDSLSQTAGDHGVTVAMPVPVPDGVRYETTVGE